MTNADQTPPTGKALNRQRVLRRFFRNPLSVIGLVVVLVLLFIAIFAPLVAPHDPAKQHLIEKLPGAAHERLALKILVAARRLADQHNLCLIAPA